MRITFVLPRASLSGGTRVVAIYVQQLMDLGHDVYVVSHKQQFSPLRKLWNKVKARRSYKKKPRSTLLDFMGTRHIIVDQDRPESLNRVPDADVVIATWWHTAPWVAGMPPEKGRKFYFLQDYEMFEYTPHDQVAATYDLPLRKITVSGYIRECLARNHGIPDIPVVPNSVDLNQFNAPPRPKNKALTLGFLYTAKPRKRAQLAVDAVIAARERWPDLQVRVFGGKAPDNPDDIPSWVQYNVNPAQMDIPGIYAGCDAWLFPSEEEGFGLPILEAMACRTPVIAAPAGAAPDLVDGNNGVLVAGTQAAFVDAIEMFHTMDPTDWAAMSDAAWKCAHTYSWTDATQNLLALLSDVAQDGKST